MKSIWISLAEELIKHKEQVFALVINGQVLQVSEGNLVYAEYNSSGLSFFIRVRNSLTKKYDRQGVGLDSIREVLENKVKYYDIDFSEIVLPANASYGISVNVFFKVVFIDTPPHVLLNAIVSQHLGEDHSNIYRLDLPHIPSTLMDKIKASWYRLYPLFLVDSIQSYINIFELAFKRKLALKMGWADKLLFKNVLYENRTNFIFLFLDTVGLFNPFLHDPHFMAQGKSSWFYGDYNTHLFRRRGKGYTVTCMTPESFCRAISIDTYLDFDNITALWLLTSLMYVEPIPHPLVPSNFPGYIHGKFDSALNKFSSVSFTLDLPSKEDISAEDLVQESTSFDFFVEKYSPSLTNFKLKSSKLRDILSHAELKIGGYN